MTPLGHLKVKARVRKGNTVTEAFFCHTGFKQGEITSPVLFFSLFINELATDIINQGSHGIQVIPDMAERFIVHSLTISFYCLIPLLDDKIS